MRWVVPVVMLLFALSACSGENDMPHEPPESGADATAPAGADTTSPTEPDGFYEDSGAASRPDLVSPPDQDATDPTVPDTIDVDAAADVPGDVRESIDAAVDADVGEDAGGPPGPCHVDDWSCVAGYYAPPPGMVAVPPGEFRMGAYSDWYDAGSSTVVSPSPPHWVWVSTFALDRLETTTAEFVEFLNAVGDESVDGVPYIGESERAPFFYDETNERYEVVEGQEDHPAGDLTWDGADAYCRWRGKRLPTEAEWERAARGQDERWYPWGDELRPDTGDYRGPDSGEDDRSSSPVGSYPAGVAPCGALDMAGNVSEWVSDWLAPQATLYWRPGIVDTYFEVSPYRDPRGLCEGAVECPEAEGRIVRGGSFDDHASATNPWSHISAAVRQSRIGWACQECIFDLGVRCAAPLEPLSCEGRPDGAPCLAPRDCSRGGECQAGVCVDEDRSCDDSDPCTVDVCVDGVGCEHTADRTLPDCSDACVTDGDCPTPPVATDCDEPYCTHRNLCELRRQNRPECHAEPR